MPFSFECQFIHEFRLICFEYHTAMVFQKDFRINGKISASVITPYWHETPFEINGFQADLSLDLLHQANRIEQWQLGAHCGRLGSHQ